MPCNVTDRFAHSPRGNEFCLVQGTILPHENIHRAFLEKQRSNTAAGGASEIIRPIEISPLDFYSHHKIPFSLFC